MITERTEIDKVEVTANGIVQVRQATIYTENNTELFRKFVRWSLTPGQDISFQEEKVQAICRAVWTESVINEYKNRKIV
jgi:hypothetical protein